MSRLGAIGRYAPRPIRFLQCARCGDTTLKVYGISHTAELPDEASITAGLGCAEQYLATPRPSMTLAGVDWRGLPTHGLGSLIVHRGREAIFVLLHIWVDENMLRHQVWASTLAPPYRFESLAPADMDLCVWELAVIQHERAAWLRHILTPSGRSDVDAFLRDTLNADV